MRGDTQAVVHPLDPRDVSRRAVEPGLGQPLDRKAHPLFDLTVIGVGLRAQDREVAHFPEGAEGSLILGTVVDLQGCQGLPEEREPLRLLEGDLLISEIVVGRLSCSGRWAAASRATSMQRRKAALLPYSAWQRASVCHRRPWVWVRLALARASAASS